MFGFLKRLIGKKELKPGESTVVRTIEDIKISVIEGHGGTRDITVQAWTPKLAKDMFFEIRDKLLEEK